MKFNLLFGFCFINFIHGNYLLVDVDDTQNAPIESNENRCRYPPCRPSPPMKDSTCISPGGRCSMTTTCCKGHICMDLHGFGFCLLPRVNIGGSGQINSKGKG